MTRKAIEERIKEAIAIRDKHAIFIIFSNRRVSGCLPSTGDFPFLLQQIELSLLSFTVPSSSSSFGTLVAPAATWPLFPSPYQLDRVICSLPSSVISYSLVDHPSEEN